MQAPSAKSMSSESSGAGGSPSPWQRARALLSHRWIRLSLVLALFGLSTWGALEQPLADVAAAPPTTGSWAWWLHPIQRNTDLTLPRLDGSPRALHPVDGTTDVWAAGLDGLVLHSPDDGVTWEQLPPALVFGEDEPVTDLAAVQAFADGRVFVAGGDEAPVLLASQDGGASWDALPAPTQAPLVSFQASADDGRMALVDTQGRCHASADGGATWIELTLPLFGGSSGWSPEQQTSPKKQGEPTLNANPNPFLDPSELLRVLWVDEQGVLCETDGGVALFSWTGALDGLRSVPSDSSRFRLTVDARSQVWWLADDEDLWQSLDRGVSWNRLQGATGWIEPIADAAYLMAAACTEGGRLGLVISDEYTLGVSRDGAATWEWFDTELSPEWMSLAEDADSQSLWACDGVLGTVWRFDADGLHQVLQGGRSILPDRIEFAADGRHGVRLIAQQAFITQDAGVTWERVPTSTMHTSVAVSDGVGDRWLAHSSMTGEATGLQRVPPDGPTVAVDLPDLEFDGTAHVEAGPDGSPLWIEDHNRGLLYVWQGGALWNAAIALRSPFLYDFSSQARLSALGENGYALVEDDGLARTADGGQTWEATPHRLDGEPIDLACSADGQLVGVLSEDQVALSRSAGMDLIPLKGPPVAAARLDVSAWPGAELWVADAQGGLWSADATGDWRRRPVNLPGTDTPAFIESIHRHPDGRRAWLGLAGGGVLRSEDGGASWAASEYAVWFAPWWWLAVAAQLGLLLWASRIQTPPPRQTISAAFTTDRPLKPGDPDPLDLDGLAAGVSRFLANENTTPPLTLAVTGSWGSGKSSLMNLVRARLAHYGFRSVWFNAWHHQTEDDMLAALLAHLRHAIPAWWHPQGLGFRVRLLLRRSRRHWVPVTVLLAVALIFRGRAEGWVDDLLTALASSSAGEETADEVTRPGVLETLLLTYLPGVSAVLAPLLLLSRSLGTFQLHSSRLGKLVLGGLRLGPEEAAAGLRQEVATTLADVTAALGSRRLVLYVDDLDRCQPDKAVQVLELVNFLTSSADVLILMGLAPRQVLHAIGFEMRDIAVSFHEDEQVDGSGDLEEDTNGQRERQAVRAYARRYLEKLINIEVPIPEGAGQRTAELLVASSHPTPEDGSDGSAPDREPWWRPLWRQLSHPRLARAAVVLAALLGAYLTGLPGQEPTSTGGPGLIAVLGDGPGPASVVTSGDEVPDDLASGGIPATELDDEDPWAPYPMLRSGSARLIPPADRPSPLASVLGVLVTLAALGALRLGRPPKQLESDTPAFITALETWAPVLNLRLRTPRSLKRFLNMVRFYAMTQRRDDDGAGPLDEGLLVSLAAMQHVHPQWLREEALWQDMRAFLEARQREHPEALPIPSGRLPDERNIERVRGTFQEMVRGVSLAPSFDGPR